MNKYTDLLGIPADQCPPDHYLLLGLEGFESNEETIKEAFQERYAHLTACEADPSLKAYESAIQELLTEVVDAGTILKDRKKRAAYDARLIQTHDTETTASASDPAVRRVEVIAPSVATPESDAETPAQGWREGGPSFYLGGLIGLCAGLLISVVVYFLFLTGGEQAANEDGRPGETASTQAQTDEADMERLAQTRALRAEKKELAIERLKLLMEKRKLTSGLPQ